MSKCETKFKEALKDLKQRKNADELLEDIKKIKEESLNDKDFAARADEYLKYYQIEMRGRASMRAEAISHDAFNKLKVSERIEAFTDKKGRQNLVGVYRSLLVQEARAGKGAINSHNLEAYRDPIMEKYDAIMSHYIEGSTPKERMELRKFEKAVMDGVYTKEALDYVESGGKAQVNEGAKRLGEMIITVQKSLLREKKLAGFLETGLEGYHLSAKEIYDGSKLTTDADRAEWVNLMFDNIDKTNFGSKSDADIKQVLADVAKKLYDNKDNIKGIAHIDKLVSDSFRTRFEKRYSRQRKFKFKDGGFYNLYSKYGGGNILDSLKADVRGVATDVSMRKVFGPMALDNIDHGMTAMKQHVVDLLNEKINTDPVNKDFYKKQLEDFKKGIVQNLAEDVPGLRNIPILHEQAILDHFTGASAVPGNVVFAEKAAAFRAVALSAKLGMSFIASVPDMVSMVSRISEISGKSYATSSFVALKETLNLITDKAKRQQILKEVAAPMESGLSLLIAESTAQTRAGKFGKKVGRFFRQYAPITKSQEFFRKVLAAADAQETAKALRTPWNQLDKVQKKTFERFGINENVAKIISEHGISNPHGTDMVMADLLYNVPDDVIKGMDEFKIHKTVAQKKEALVSQVRGYFYQRSKTGVPMKGAKVSAGLSMGQRPGTVLGEAVNMVTPLKSVMLAVWENSLDIYRTNIDNGLTGKMRIAEYSAGMMAAGYTVIALRDMINGDEPPDPTAPETISRMLVASGILGPLSEISFSRGEDITDKLGSFLGNPVTSLAGQTAGAAWDAITLDTKEGPVAFAKNLYEGKTQKYQDQILDVWKNIPGNNLPQVKFPLMFFLNDTIRQIDDPKYRQKGIKRRKKNSGLLWNQDKF